MIDTQRFGRYNPYKLIPGGGYIDMTYMSGKMANNFQQIMHSEIPHNSHPYQDAGEELGIGLIGMSLLRDASANEKKFNTIVDIRLPVFFWVQP